MGGEIRGLALLSFALLGVWKASKLRAEKWIRYKKKVIYFGNPEGRKKNAVFDLNALGIMFC